MKGIKVVHAVGARPNFVKMAPVVQALAARPGFEQRIVHTGQHYDPMLSEEILADLEFPPPTDFLGVGSGSHGEQTARALESFERILLSGRPDLIVVSGDVNSTLACALAAAKLGIAIGHVESGLRSGDWSMPEEINRVLTDRLSDFLFTHSPEAIDNLVREGIDPERIHHVGNSMIDSLRRLEPAARRLARWEGLGLLEHDYVLVTLHRPANVDETRRLAAVAGALAELAGRAPVVFPIHPRTRKRLAEENLLGLLEAAGVHCLEPTGYVAFLSLELGAGAIVTDSGGVQEEAAAFGVRCYTLRSTTERPITVSHGTNVVLGEDVAALAGVEPTRRPPVPCVIPLWDGHAGERIADVLAEHFAVEARPADVVLA
jgi:UDP-N-acetylglucosamine 2-epimerase (non-hydrolysing)